MTIGMSNSLTSKLSDLSVTANPVSANPEVFNGVSESQDNQIRAEKTNPWKSRPIQPSENKLLEADVWPEPSAPLERRSFNQKIEEKPKNKKLKWREIEIEPPVHSSAVRGRGRFSGMGSGSAPVYQGPSNSGQMRNRRGSGYGRGRISDSGRGMRPMNGYYQRLPDRAPFPRNQPDEKSHRPVLSGDSNSQEPIVSTAPAPATYDTENPSPKSARQSDETHERQNVSHSGYPAQQEHASSSVSTTRGTNTGEQTDKVTSELKSSPQGVTNRRYMGNTTDSTGRPTRYTESSFNRPRRPPVRGHGYGYTNSPKGAAIAAPTLPIPAVAPVTYLLPGLMPGCMGGALLNPGVAISPNTVTERRSTLEGNPVQAILLPAQAVPVVAGDQTQISAAPIVPLQASTVTAGGATSNSASEIPESPAITSQVAEVVSLEQMLEYIMEVGWNKTKIPEWLKDNPTISAAAASNADTQNKVEESETSEAHSQSSDSAKASETERSVKRDDVVIVDNTVFFVPRNSHHTKFLKFRSKLDYIRHHVEYYFSDANLHRDYHLVTILSENDHTCPLESLLQFNRLRWAKATESELLEAVVSSPAVSVVYSKDNQPVGVSQNTAMSVVRSPSAYPIPSKTSASDTNPPAPAVTSVTSEASRPVASPDDPKSSKQDAENEAPSATTSTDTVATVDSNNFFVETVMLPFYAGGQVPHATYANLPFVMQQQRIQVPTIGQAQLSQPQHFYALQSSQGYLLPPAYMYPSPVTQQQNISLLQFSNQTPYYVSATGTPTHPSDPSSLATAQAVAAAAAAQQQTAPFPSAQPIYAVPQSVSANVNGTGHASETTTSSPIVPAYYRLAMHQPSYSQYAAAAAAASQAAVGSTNPILLHFLPTIQSSMSTAFVPTGIPATTPNTTLAAIVGGAGNSRTQVNPQGGGTFVPLTTLQNMAQASPQLPSYPGAAVSPASSTSVSGTYGQKLSTVSARPHHNQMNQRLVNSQYTQVAAAIVTTPTPTPNTRPANPTSVEPGQKSSPVSEEVVDVST
ncbi:hypothetical protein AAHC03_010063 [Spirometra sp. Aus1]